MGIHMDVDQTAPSMTAPNHYHRGGQQAVARSLHYQNNQAAHDPHSRLSGPSEWLLNSLASQPKMDPEPLTPVYSPETMRLLDTLTASLMGNRTEKEASESTPESSESMESGSMGDSANSQPQRQLRLRPSKDEEGLEAAPQPTCGQVHLDMPGQPCSHQAHWKRLRHKKGWTYFICTECNIKWKRTT